MRTIKFRGKSKTTGRWLYGYYQEHEDGRVAILPALNGELQEASDYEVIPETVGQYIEKKDKYGNEIYEGDIISVDGKYPKLVEFSLDNLAFRVVNVEDFKLYPDFNCWQLPTAYWWAKFNRRFEITGNKWDNPELLKGDDE